MTVRAEVKTGQLAELLKQVQAGNEVLLTQNQEPVAKLVAAASDKTGRATEFVMSAFTGHRVLTPEISQAEIADELFGPR